MCKKIGRMTTFSTLSFIPPQVSGKMEYNVSLNNILSNQIDRNKDIRIRFPKLSFSAGSSSANMLTFIPWLKGDTSKTKCDLGFGVRATYELINSGEGDQYTHMYYLNANYMPNAIKTEEGIYVALEDTIIALNKVLKLLALDMRAGNIETIYTSTNGFAYRVRIPAYTAKIEDGHFILESDYPLPVTDTQTELNFSESSITNGWVTTNVLPHACRFFDDKEEQSNYVYVGKGLVNKDSNSSGIKYNEIEPYLVIPPGGIYHATYGGNSASYAYYVFIADGKTRDFYKFLPWTEDSTWGVHLDPSFMFLNLGEEVIFSNGKYQNYAQQWVDKTGFYYIETRKHYFKFPLDMTYKYINKGVIDYAVRNNSEEEGVLNDIRFIHLSFESAFFVPSYFVRGKDDGSQQLVNNNIIYTFDSIKDQEMFKNGKFYLDENTVLDLPFISTKAYNMDSYNVTIRVLGEDLNGNVSVLDGSNFYIQMKFEYD